MSLTAFEPDADLIVVRVRLWGPSGEKDAMMALDTAASEVVLSHDIVDSLGYSPRDAISLSSVTSVLGREVGYRLRVLKVEALGFEFSDFAVIVHDFHDASIDGLLGLGFLRHFNYEIRSKEGVAKKKRGG